LPLRYWFAAFYLLTSAKKSFSPKELQRRLGHKHYESVWALLRKLRAIMGRRDSEYTLEGIIEPDEDFFSTEVPEKDKQLKRGRGSQKKSKVLVMAESVPVDREEGVKRMASHAKSIISRRLS
jgi:hypothetical protein